MSVKNQDLRMFGLKLNTYVYICIHLKVCLPTTIRNFK